MNGAVAKRSQFRPIVTLEKDTSPSLSVILDSIRDYLPRFIAFSSKAQVVAVSLWIAHTWAIKAFDYTPYLYICSPLKRCGKSLLLDCIGLLVANPWQVVQPTEAVLFRKIEADQPTLLLDEVDTIFSARKDDGKESLRALLNSGFERRTTVPRCVPPNYDVKEFRVFCPKALAGIGRLPDTVSDRCIPLRLVRRSREESVERFRKREAEAFTKTICEQLAKWAECEDTIEQLRASRPDMPSELGDRQADISEPLLAIADMAGDEWPDLARTALVTLFSDDSEEDDSLGVKLLSGIQSIFAAKESDRLATIDILKGLVASDEDAPWAAWWERDLADNNTRGPAGRLAKLLKPFDIRARAIRLSDNSTPRGYLFADFKEAWKRYCPPKPA